MNVRDISRTTHCCQGPPTARTERSLPATTPRPESRRVSAAGQRPTAPRAGAPSRDAPRPGATAERHHEPQTTPVAAPPRGRALPSVRAGRQGTLTRCARAWLTVPTLGLFTLAAQPAAADFLGIPLERQPFIKVCPDGPIVGSLSPNLTDVPAEAFGAFAYDGRTGRAEFIRRAPGFEQRLAANPCLRQPIRMERKR